MKISVVISAYNEERLLEDCLVSVQDFADEIIVVDNSSTDRTKEIAKKFTKKVFTQKNDPTSIDLQKNFGFGKATNEWILSLDADERLTPELSKEIIEVLRKNPSEINGYRIPRKNIIFGKWIEHSLWWPDYQVRLFRKEKGQYAAEKVHQQLQVQGEVGTMKEAFLHENYQSISQYLQKMDRYTENEAKALLKDNVHMHWIDMLRLPVRDFLKTFFLQKGYKDGLHGLVLSILQSGYSFLVVTKVWEKQGFAKEEGKNFLPLLFVEWRKLHQETLYWFFAELGSQTRNPLLKLKYRLQQKNASKKIK